MSKRSRRFLAAKERATLPSEQDHPAAQAGPSFSTLVPTLRTAIRDPDQDTSMPAKPAATAAGSRGDSVLASSGKRLGELTTQVVKWGKQHPVRMAGAAAALIAAAGFLTTIMRGKAAKVRKAGKAKVAGVVGMARTAKAGVKAKARKAMKDVKSMTRGGARMRPSLAMD